jgi:SAM-dependent methyltransferase
MRRFAQTLWLTVRRRRYGVIDLVLFTAVLAGILIGWSTFRSRQLTAAAFQSPLSEVRAAQEELIPDSVAYRRQYDFTVNWFTWNIPVWETVLAPFQGKPNVRYLEVGLYEGRSAVWMLEHVLTHPTARLTGVDVFDGPHKDRCFANIERTGAPAKATLITGYSQLVLRGLPLNSFDIIYVDGSHAKNDVLEDAVLSWRLLREGGILIFDDYRWAGSFVSGTSDSPTDFPKAAIDPFVQCFEKQFDVIHNSYQLILRKKAAKDQ